MQSKAYPSDRVRSYFLAEKPLLFAVTLTGIIYNLGLAVGPWLEGRLIQVLWDILSGMNTAQAMLLPALLYALVLSGVQFVRFLKRLYVRRFANHISRRIKLVIYRNVLTDSSSGEDAGSLMTRAISDADACAEGMRKFTTEVFDTGVAIIAYAASLALLDWKLTLISLSILPVAYYSAEKMKGVVSRTSIAAKESQSRLNRATLDRVSGALTYRSLGLENVRNAVYEQHLTDYEKKNICSNILVTSLYPLYRVIAMIGAIAIIYLGGRNVLGQGWSAWNIAAFSTFLTTFIKLATKTSRAAKMFNAIQKANVSWKRIVPFLKDKELPGEDNVHAGAELVYNDVSVSFGDHQVIRGANFTAKPGQIIGITGEVASGKSTLGIAALGEYAISGSITYGGIPLDIRSNAVGYLGHRPELISATIEDNIRLGKDGDVNAVLRAVCLDEDIRSFPEGLKTRVGEGGIRLSGGQQARLALARTLFHARPVLILDDPFSAVDMKTEAKIYKNLREMTSDRVVLLISHRLALFEKTDGVLWIESGSVTASDHRSLMESCSAYRRLCLLQKGGEHHEA